MGLTEFPNGMTSFGMPLVGGMYLTSGNVFFVHNGTGSNGNTGEDTSHAFGSLDYAIGKCTPSKADYIFLMPGHSETLTADGAITFDIQGVTVVGIGRGTDRPTFLLDAAAADIAITAANVGIKNCLFQAGFADVVECFDLSATGFTLESVEFADYTSNENFIDYILTSAVANQCDDLTVIGCRAVSADTGADTMFIHASEDIDGLILHHNFISLGVKNDKALLHAENGKDWTNVDIKYNSLSRLNASEATAPCVMYSDQTGNSGIAAWNACGNADTDAANIWDVTGVRLVENYVGRAVDKNGVIIPTAA